MTNITRSVLMSWTTSATANAVDVLVALRGVLGEVDAWNVTLELRKIEL